MKQKIVIKVSMNDDKSRSKAMQITFRLQGIEKGALEGPERDRIEVIGDGVDIVALVTSLRNRLGFAELVSVSPAAEPPKAQSSQPQCEIRHWPYIDGGMAAHHHYYPDSYSSNSCSIV